MARSLEMMWNALTSFLSNLWTTVQPALESTLQRLDPLTWGIIAVGLLILLLLVPLLRRRRFEEPAPSKPELLVSLGEIRILEDYTEKDEPSGHGAGRGSLMRPVSHALRMTVSNLNAYPVQLLEIALKTPEMNAAVTLEVAQIIAPEASVKVKEALPQLEGEEGKLTLYFYLSGGSKRYVSLQANFEFEPWDARYKVSPLGQTLTPFRQLASANVSKQKERSWQEGREKLAQEARREKVAAFADQSADHGWREERRPESVRENERDERPANGFNFPDEF